MQAGGRGFGQHLLARVAFIRRFGMQGLGAKLEHDPQKWKPLLRQDHAQTIDLARVLFDQVIPPGRNAR
jgi:hypothetical protein